MVCCVFEPLGYDHLEVLKKSYSLLQISKTIQDKGGASTSTQQPAEGSTTQVPEDIFSYYEQMDKEEEEEEETQTVSCEIRQVSVLHLLTLSLFMYYITSQHLTVIASVYINEIRLSCFNISVFFFHMDHFRR